MPMANSYRITTTVLAAARATNIMEIPNSLLREWNVDTNNLCAYEVYSNANDPTGAVVSVEADAQSGFPLF
jgi:hypothetical protein